MRRDAVSGEFCAGQPRALPAEEYRDPWRRWFVDRGGAPIQLLYLRVSSEHTQPRRHLQEQVPGEWASYWFYHKVPLDPVTKRRPLVVKKIANLGETPKVEVERVVENEGYLSILREVSKTLGVCDVTEEFAACGCFPVKEGWSVSSWAPEEKRAFGLPTADFGEAFQLRKRT